ncbi:MAG: methyltransferase [Deltaproteobacteria bacterium]|nr:methyltransferase [Deltaproteobacteria bacterium]
MPIRYALIRHLAAILALPFTIAVLVPLWIAQRWAIAPRAPAGLLEALVQGVGGLALLLGIALFASSLYLIATRGQGTLAPWDPPRRLVVSGPYRRVRNPMISGVLFALFGEALLLLSLPHLLLALAFLALNLVYIPLLEEPQLEARFGDEYRRYRRHVSRFVPRLRSWNPEAD